MATWVEPIDSSTDPDAPLTSELAKRWDYNIVAAFEGDALAPKLQSGGHPSFAAATTYTLERITMPSEEYEFAEFSSDGSVSGIILTKMHEFTAMRAGSVTVTGEFKGILGGAYMTVWVNGVLVHTSTPSSTGSFVAASYNVSFLASNHVRIYCGLNYNITGGGGTASGEVRNLRLTADQMGVYRR